MLLALGIVVVVVGTLVCFLICYGGSVPITKECAAGACQECPGREIVRDPEHAAGAYWVEEEFRWYSRCQCLCHSGMGGSA